RGSNLPSSATRNSPVSLLRHSTWAWILALLSMISPIRAVSCACWSSSSSMSRMSCSVNKAMRPPLPASDVGASAAPGERASRPGRCGPILGDRSTALALMARWTLFLVRRRRGAGAFESFGADLVAAVDPQAGEPLGRAHRLVQGLGARALQEPFEHDDV